MISRYRHWVLAAAVLAIVLASIGWSWASFDEDRSEALAAMREADACQSLAKDIAAVRSPGASAGAEPARQTELSRQIARAATEAGLPERSVERIEHDAPRHTAGGGTIEKPTRITIVGGTLPQLGALFASLDRPREGVRLSSIHLAAPNDSADASAWTAEATLIDTLPSNRNTDPATHGQ